MKRTSESGFTLIELVVIMAILTIIFIMAVPNLTKAKRSAQSPSAISSLRSIVTCEMVHSRDHRYIDLNLLRTYGCLDEILASGVKSGYTFSLSIPPDEQSFTIQATPNDDASECMYLYADQTGVIRCNFGSPAGPSSEPIPR